MYLTVWVHLDWFESAPYSGYTGIGSEVYLTVGTLGHYWDTRTSTLACRWLRLDTKKRMKRGVKSEEGTAVGCLGSGVVRRQAGRCDEDA